MRANGQATVGAFVLGGIVLAIGAIVLFGKFNLFNPMVKAAIVFQDSVSGLSVGAPVSFRGVRVGAVQSVGIDFNPESKVAYIPVIITLTQDPARSRGQPIELATLIKRGLRAELNVQSFVTGQSEIDLDFAPSTPAVLHAGVTSLPEIPTRQSTLQRAREELSQLPLRQLANDADATLHSLRGLSEKLEEDLPPLVDSLKTTSDRSAHAVLTADQAITELQSRLDTTLTTFTRVADSGGGDLHTLLTESNQTMLQLRDLLTDVKGLTSTRAAARANIESTLRDLAAAAASLRGFANDVEHDPRLLLTGRKP